MQIIIAYFLIFSFLTLISCANNNVERNDNQEERRLTPTEFLLRKEPEPLSEQKEREKRIKQPRKA